MTPVEVYRVGLFETIPAGRWRTSRRYLAYQLRRRNWRAVRNHIQGMRAEHPHCSHSAGRAFTERAAIRKAARHCQEAAA